MESPKEIPQIDSSMRATDSYLLSIPSAKLCRDCGQLKTLARIINQTETEQQVESALKSSTQDERSVKETESTVTVVENPKQSLSKCSVKKKNILTVSERLSALSNEEEIESIESIGQSLPIKKESSTFFGKNVRTEASLARLKEEHIMEKVQEKKMLYELSKQMEKKESTEMIISLTDLDISIERNNQDENEIVWKELKFNPKTGVSFFKRIPGRIFTRISNALRFRKSQ